MSYTRNLAADSLIDPLTWLGERAMILARSVALVDIRCYCLQRVYVHGCSRRRT